MMFFTDIEKSAPKFKWKHRRPWITKNLWAERVIPDFKLYFRVIVIKKIMVLTKKQRERPMG
jgi:hypothetical protein